MQTEAKTAGDGLLADVIANPADDTPRLIYADWLEDNGRKNIADFIRERVGEPKRGTFVVWHWDGWKQTGWPRRRVGPGRPVFAFDDNEIAAWLTAGFPEKDESLEMVVTRGFVSAVECPPAVWLKHGPAVVRRRPVERVAFPGKRPRQVNVGYRWSWSDDEGRYNSDERCVPMAVYEFLVGHDGQYKMWPTAELAIEALSAACLLCARETQEG